MNRKIKIRRRDPDKNLVCNKFDGTFYQQKNQAYNSKNKLIIARSMIKGRG